MPYGKVQNKKIGRILALLMTLMLIFSVYSVGVMAESAEGDTAESSAAEQMTTSDLTVPSPTENFYIYDAANVLTETTENEIITRNTDLNTKYGMQIVVMTMDQIPGEDFNSKVSFANQVITQWKIGGENGYGLLLVLSISDQDYVAVAADGFKTEFTSDVLKKLLDEELEPSFKVEAYDAGVKNFASVAANQAEAYMEKVAAAAAKTEIAEEETGEKGNVFLGVLKGIGIFLLVVLILLVILLVVVNIHGQMVRKKRREARRRRAALNTQRPARREPSRTDVNSNYRDFMDRYQ